MRRPVAARAARLDRAAGGGDDVLDDREAEPGAAGGAGGVGAPEALEEAGQVAPRRRRSRRRRRRARSAPGSRATESVKRGAVARVADRVLGQVLGDDPEHPRAQRQVDVAGRRRPSGSGRHARRARSSSATTCSSTGSAFVRPSETTSRAALELGEEEDLVDQRAGVLTSARACVEQRLRRRRRAGRPSRAATRMRASGVRSSCETEAVKPGSQLVEGDVLGGRLGDADRHGHRLARFGLDRRSPLPAGTASSPDRHHSDTRFAPDTALW